MYQMINPFLWCKVSTECIRLQSANEQSLSLNSCITEIIGRKKFKIYSIFIFIIANAETLLWMPGLWHFQEHFTEADSFLLSCTPTISHTPFSFSFTLWGKKGQNLLTLFTQKRVNLQRESDITAVQHRTQGTRKEGDFPKLGRGGKSSCYKGQKHP